MNSIEINTSQNVNIRFRLAGVGDRMLAFVLDMLIKGAYLVFVFVFVFRWLDLWPLIQAMDDWSAYALVGLFTLPADLYTLFFESFLEGQTPGKRVMRIRVVKVDGYQASFADYFIRWIFRTIDIYIGMAVVGILSMVINRDNKRLGDIAAGTAVISLKNSYNINHTILVNLENDYHGRFPQVVRLSDNDMRIIKENYLKARAQGDRQLLARLAAKVRSVVELPESSQEMTDTVFLKTVIEDYNYFTGQEA